MAPMAPEGRLFPLRHDAEEAARDEAEEKEALRDLWRLKMHMHDPYADLPLLAAEWLATLEVLRGARFRLGMEAGCEPDPVMPPMLRDAIPERMADTASGLV